MRNSLGETFGLQLSRFPTRFWCSTLSVLGPKTSLLGEIIRQRGFKYHRYADDNQVYITLKRRYNIDETVHGIEDCLTDISTWVESNHLKHYQTKPEVSQQCVKKTWRSMDVSLKKNGKQLCFARSIMYEIKLNVLNFIQHY